ncbi:hypothetical protein ACIQXD_01650 [Streptomyces uncialis]|uniref:hypothetical protein n=1 Tax=Streptomyces uncialis TaxID=1048205 RepID=UPI0037FEC066
MDAAVDAAVVARVGLDCAQLLVAQGQEVFEGFSGLPHPFENPFDPVSPRLVGSLVPCPLKHRNDLVRVARSLKPAFPRRIPSAA